MILYDKGRLLVGVKISHLLLVLGLAALTLVAMPIYRECTEEFTNLRRVEGGWKVEWTGAWHPWAERETFAAFKKDGDYWRWMENGRAFGSGKLEWLMRDLRDKALVEEFKNR